MVVNESIISLQTLSASGEINAAVDLVLERIEQWFAVRDQLSVDQFLQALDPSQVHPRVTASALRCSSRAKESLSHWKTLQDKATQCLDFNDPAIKRLFRGL